MNKENVAEFKDFLMEITDAHLGTLIMYYQSKAKDLLKSFNSDSPDEGRNINKHKAKGKVCPKCGGNDTIYTIWCNYCATTH